MARISAFRSDEARAAYCRLYDAALAATSMPVTESDVETSFGRRRHALSPLLTPRPHRRADCASVRIRGGQSFSST
jgi:hypothetical protein